MRSSDFVILASDGLYHTYVDRCPWLMRDGMSVAMVPYVDAIAVGAQPCAWCRQAAAQVVQHSTQDVVATMVRNWYRKREQDWGSRELAFMPWLETMTRPSAATFVPELLSTTQLRGDLYDKQVKLVRRRAIPQLRVRHIGKNTFLCSTLHSPPVIMSQRGSVWAVTICSATTATLLSQRCS